MTTRSKLINDVARREPTFSEGPLPWPVADLAVESLIKLMQAMIRMKRQRRQTTKQTDVTMMTGPEFRRIASECP